MASPEEMAAAMVANMKEKTGKTLPQWLKITRAAGLARHGEIVKLLKGEHGMTHGFANLVAQRTLAEGQAAAGAEDLVAAQYRGPKAELRPLYEALIQAVQKFGADVEVSPKKSYVSLRRRKQFGLVKAATRTRIDVGLNLKGVAPEGRLEAAGSLGSMVTHRMTVSARKDVDKVLIGWLKKAYESA